MDRPSSVFFGVILLCAIFIFPENSCAENKYHVFTVSPFIGGRLLEGNQPLDGSATGGLAFGYNFSEVWSAEGVFAYSPSEHAGRDVHIFDVRMDILYHFRPYGHFVPYLAGGAGALFAKREGSSADNDLQIAFGGGFKYFITENIALRGDVRPILDINVGDTAHTPDTYWNLLCSAGVVFQLDSPKETRAALDTDEDGVVDVVDECLDTPPGVPVTRRGCSRDTDRDGVPDYRDLCPGSPLGIVVTGAGCPAPPRGDEDSDGVEDQLDHCPNTPFNVPVNAVGCPM